MSSVSPPVAIGEAARLSGVSQRMVRHYEALGLLKPVGRTEAGYRQYGEADVHTLRFIKRSRQLGFSMADIGQLVSLWQDDSRSSASVKRIAQDHVMNSAGASRQCARCRPGCSDCCPVATAMPARTARSLTAWPRLR